MGIKKILLPLVFLTVFPLPDTVVCQTVSTYPLDRLEKRIETSEISFSYTYEAERGKVSMKGQGKTVIQGNAYILDVDGMEIYCDGTSKWTLDRGAQELVIEDYDGYTADISADPVLLLGNLTGFFEVSSQSYTEFDGHKALKVSLSPKSESKFKGVILYFRDDPSESDILVGASVEMSDGTVTDFSISDFRYDPKGDLSRFSFDSSSLDSSWVITDLR